MKITNAKAGDQREFVLVFDPGEEVISTLEHFASTHRIELGSFTAIGGFEELSLGFFNLQTSGFDPIDYNPDQVEILSLTGEITRLDGKPHVHIHTVVGQRDGTTRGGHLLKGVIRPILIVNMAELAAYHGHHH